MRKLLFLTLAALPLFAAAQVPSYVPTNGLVGWWPFNGNANDESGNGNNGTVNGATLTNDRNNIGNSSYGFNGISNYIDVNDNASLRLNGSDYTISFWTSLNTYNTSGATAFIYKRSSGAQNGWGLGADQGNQNKVSLIVSENTDPRGYSTSTLTLNTWHNVTIVYQLSNQEMRIYFDGLLNAVTTGVDNNLNPVGGMPSPSATCSSVMRFGQDSKTNGYFLNGKLDDIGIWNRSLSPQEISGLYYSCSNSVTAQPANQSVATGNNAVFATASSDPNATYQWQTDLGLGFQNLSNAGQYSGVTTNTMNVNSVNAGNNNQAFRCIVSSGNCTDTTQTAYITITTGITEETNSSFTVFPNPANNNITVTWATPNVNTLTLSDATGRAVRTYNVSGTQAQLSLEGLASGVYFLSEELSKGVPQKVIIEK